MESRTFRVNEPTVATEKLDNEVMIVNLEKGNYYSLNGVGAVIWDLLASGHTEGSILSEIVEGYAGDSGVMRQSLDRFVSELRAEELIVASDLEPASGSHAPERVAAGERPEFAAPRLEKYTDMQELLLIDPIHEVNDDHGWPKMRS
jgi:Coenzyme PQQ synthesis protein D (PqqD)